MIEKSPILTKMNTLRRNGVFGSRLLGALVRDLTKDEILQLEKQGNICDDWGLVFVALAFTPAKVAFNRFSGCIVLGDFHNAGGIFYSYLENTEVGSESLVEHCSFVRSALIDHSCRIINSIIDCESKSSFGVGEFLCLGQETPGKELPLWDSMTLDSVVSGVKNPQFHQQIHTLQKAVECEFSYIGPQSQILSLALGQRIFLSGGQIIQGASRLENSSFLGPDIFVGSGCSIVNSILYEGAIADSDALIDTSALLEFSGAQRKSLVTQSVLGPNSVIGEGEVTASLIGPFVGMHHQSLLIAAWWPEGRGNIGYGANVGSNHTSRMPDQQIWPGEGTFFGLGTVIKFPANFSEAPYCIFASGVTLLPQRLGLPFSLISGEASLESELIGLNRVVPGWNFSNNLYGLLRNEHKYLKRNKAKQHSFDLQIFRPDILNKVKTALEFLENLEPKSYYYGLQMLGKNYLLEKDRIAGIEAYRDLLTFGFLRLYVQALLRSENTDFFIAELEHLGLKYSEPRQYRRLFLQNQTQAIEAARKSKQKDELRGCKIIPDYAATHESAETDSFLAGLLEDLKTWEVKLEQFLN